MQIVRNWNTVDRTASISNTKRIFDIRGKCGPLLWRCTIFFHWPMPIYIGNRRRWETAQQKAVANDRGGRLDGRRVAVCRAIRICGYGLWLLLFYLPFATNEFRDAMPMLIHFYVSALFLWQRRACNGISRTGQKLQTSFRHRTKATKNRIKK